MCNQILLETSIRKGHITFDSIVSFNFLRFAEMLRKKSYFFQVHVYLVTPCLKFAKSEDYIIWYPLYRITQSITLKIVFFDNDFI